MRTFISGTDESAPKTTTGDLARLVVEDEAEVTHTGHIFKAEAISGGKLTIMGGVAVWAVASGRGEIYSEGDSHKVEAIGEGSKVYTVGNPERATAYDGGSVTIFGNPKKITARNHAQVTVVSDSADYRPRFLVAINYGTVTILRPSSTGTEPEDLIDTAPLKDALDKLMSDPSIDSHSVFSEVLSKPAQEQFVSNDWNGHTIGME